MLKNNKIEKLMNIGGYRFTKNGEDRIYLRNTREKLIKLKIVEKNWEMVSATLDGESITNSKAKKLYCMMDDAYVDVNRNEVVIEDYDVDKIKDFRELLEKAIENL